MKKKIAASIFALVLVFALFAGCTDGKIATTDKLKIENYTLGLDYSLYGEELLKESASFTSATQLAGYVAGTGNGDLVSLCTDGNTYKLYNTKTKTLANAAYSRIEFVHCTANGQELPDLVKVYDDTAIALLDMDGNTLLSAAEYTSLNVQAGTYYLPGKAIPDVVYTVIYSTDAEQDSRKYFACVSPDGISAYRCTEVQASDLRTSPFETTVGSPLDGQNAYPIYTGLLGQTVEGFEEYTMGSEILYADNSTGLRRMNVNIYKAGIQAGQIRIENGNLLGIMDKYIYYAEAEKLPYDATKGYNVYIQSASSFTTAAKYKYTFYKYNIKKNKASKFNPGYFIQSMTPLYNYKTKKFDAAQVDAVAYENGVAVLSEYGAAKTYIVDTSFKVGFDLSNKPFTMNDLGLKLKNNRFLIEDHIVDAKLNVIASIPEAEYVYKDSQLITFQYNEYFGAVDFDGKVVLEPKYENLELAGGIAFTDVRKSVAETTPDCLVSVTNPAGTSTDKLLGDSENWLSAPLPGLLVKKNNDTDTVTLYNYAETVLATLSGVSSLHHSGTSSEHNVITFYSSTDNAYVSYLLA